MPILLGIINLNLYIYVSKCVTAIKQGKYEAKAINQLPINDMCKHIHYANRGFMVNFYLEITFSGKFSN